MPASLVYAAEDQWSAVLDRGGSVDFFGSRLSLPEQRRFADVASVQRYADLVLALEPVRSAYPTAGPVRVRERAGQRKAHYEVATATIALPLRASGPVPLAWAGREAVVLHEIVHHLRCSLGAAASSGAVRQDWHGVGFRTAMCDLVEIVLGPEAALLLRSGYEEAGLRTVPADS